MLIKTSDIKSVQPFLQNIYLPKANSHKGQNGRLLIIGGSSLFHSASIWAAEIASNFVDMVHYSSTSENNGVFFNLKNKFRNGIVVQQKNIPEYVTEDDVILIGPGMVRGKVTNYELRITNFTDILKIKNEAEYTYYLTKFLLKNYPHKKFVLDAGALQMMEPGWLTDLNTKAIVTPHQGEFSKLFGKPIDRLSTEEKAGTVQEQAKKYNCVILLKAIDDFISDGEINYIIEGGNAGLTKGGTGDVLAGLTAALYTKNQSINSCLLSSFLLKKTADQLFLHKGYWYNISSIIESIPSTLKHLLNT